MSKQTDELAERILDRALLIAEASSWEQLRLATLATSMDISLLDIHQFYRQKDDLVEAWFDRADRAVLGHPLDQAFLQLPLDQRLHQLIMIWLDALAAHRQLTRGMLAYKLEFGHVHLQTLGLLRVSRTVQWFLEAAHLHSNDLKRIIDEVSVTTLYLAGFSHWLFDASPQQMNTRNLLHRSLHHWVACRSGPPCFVGRICPVKRFVPPMG